MKISRHPFICSLAAALSLCAATSKCADSIAFAQWTATHLTLNNGVVQRIIQLPSVNRHFLTTSYRPLTGEFKYFQSINTDFQFEFNGQSYSGQSSWHMLEPHSASDAHGGNGVSVSLLSEDGKLAVTLKFLLYPNLPVIRKSLAVKNLGTAEAPLESVDVEKFNIPGYWASTFSWILSDYGRRRSLAPYDGDRQDALVIVHNPDWESGLVIGNEAPGVMKHTSVFWNGLDICSGLTHKDARYPFRKWIKPGESFETPQVFTMVYNHHKDAADILNTAVPDFVRKHMGICPSSGKEKPTFLYDTWEPLETNINSQVLMKVADAAAAAGVKLFIIDDGWQNCYGDWTADTNKFPGGLKPVFDHIKALGMKPGLWVSVGSAAPESPVFRNHPEWFVKDISGKLASVHGNPRIMTACFGTGWPDYIKGVLEKLMADYGLEYFKLDLAVVTSPYVFDPVGSGCYATNHAGHQDHAESLYSNFEALWRLFDELHHQKPGLFIDCTFESTGGLQLLDYAMLKHADGDSLSNFSPSDGTGVLRMRNMAWWRSPAMPAMSLIFGNLEMDGDGWKTTTKSLAGALPIILGDPRKLSPEILHKYRQYADWFDAMQAKYGVMSFRQDLPGFGEPVEGSWDGFQRINTDTKEGGIIGIFRQGAHESKRIIAINYLDPTNTYAVKSMDGKIIYRATGNELQTNGFACSIAEFHGGELFEVSRR